MKVDLGGAPSGVKISTDCADTGVCEALGIAKGLSSLLAASNHSSLSKASGEGLTSGAGAGAGSCTGNVLPGPLWPTTNGTDSAGNVCVDCPEACPMVCILV